PRAGNPWSPVAPAMGLLSPARVILDRLDSALARVPGMNLVAVITDIILALISAIFMASIREKHLSWPAHRVVLESSPLILGPAAIPVAMRDHASQFLHRPPLMIKVGRIAALVNETFRLPEGRVI